MLLPYGILGKLTGLEYTSVVDDTRRRTDTSSRTFGRGGWINGGSGGPAAWVQQTTSQTVEETVRNTTEEGTKSLELEQQQWLLRSLKKFLLGQGSQYRINYNCQI